MNLKQYLFYTETTVKKFAHDAGIHEAYLSSIISGSRKPSRRMLQSIEIATNGHVKAKDVCGPIKLPPELEPDIREDGDLVAKFRNVA